MIIVIGLVILTAICFVMPALVKDDTCEEIFLILGVINVVLLIAALMVVLCANVNSDAKIARLEAEREAIVYQLENETYLNDNNLGTHELFTDVGEFNGKIISGRRNHASPWTSWFVGSHYDQVDIIQYNKGET